VVATADSKQLADITLHVDQDKVIEFLQVVRLIGRPKFGYVVFYNTEVSGMGAIQVGDDSPPLVATVGFVDAKGFPTNPSGVPVWASDNEATATVVASEDGLTGTVTVGAPGAAVISAEDDQPDGDKIKAVGTVTVVPGEATLGEVNFTPSS
jgi:hypothetical protein